MPRVKANGKTFNFPEGTTQEQIGSALDEYFAGQPQQTEQQQMAERAKPTIDVPDTYEEYMARYAGEEQQPQQAPQQAPQDEGYSYATRPSDAMKLPDRETRATQELPELPEAAGFLSTEDPMKVAAIAPVLLTTTDPQEMGDILKNTFPNIGIQYDEKGNIIAGNNATGQKVVLNKPNLSKMDVLNALGIGSLYATGGLAGAGGKQALGLGGRAALGLAGGIDALTETGIQAAQAAAGGEFNPEDVALSAGFGVGGEALGQLGKTGYRAVKGAPTAEQRVVTEFAEEQGVPVMTTDVVQPETFVGKSAQQAAEKVPVTGTGGMRAAQEEGRRRVVEEAGTKFGAPRPDEIVSSLERQSNRVKQAAGRSRQNVVDQVKDVEVSSTDAIKAIDDEIKRMTTTPSGAARQAVDDGAVNTLRNYKADLEADKSFANLEVLRTNFRNDVKGSSITPTRSEAGINRIYKAMTKDMDNTVEGALGVEQLGKWKRANSVYASEMNKIKNTRLKGVLQKGDLTPEVVNGLLFSNKPSEVRMLFKSLDSRGKAAARAGLIGKAAEKAGGSPAKFLTEIKKLSGETGIFFRGADKKYVDGLTAYLEATSRASEAGVVTPTGQQLFQIAAPAGVVTDVTTTGGLTTMSAAGYGLLARAYESKPVRNAIIRLSSTPAGSAKWDQAMDVIARFVTTAAQTQKEEL